MTEPGAPEREYVGYVWWGETRHDWADGERIGVLLYAASSTEAGAIVRSYFGANVRSSLWNEEDANRPR